MTTTILGKILGCALIAMGLFALIAGNHITFTSNCGSIYRPLVVDGGILCYIGLLHIDVFDKKTRRTKE